MLNKRNIIALSTAVALLGLTSSAFADPQIGPENAQQYRVSAQETLQPRFAPKLSATALHQSGTATGSLIGAADPHWGPAFDPDVE